MFLAKRRLSNRWYQVFLIYCSKISVIDFGSLFSVVLDEIDLVSCFVYLNMLEWTNDGTPDFQLVSSKF